MPDISADLARIQDAKYGEEVRGSIHDSIRDINDVCEGNVATVTAITNTCKSYRDTAKTYQDNAKTYQDNANSYKNAAATSATNAANSATTATNKASAASTSATNAANSATTASTKASEAATSASTASTKATAAANSATSAATSATTATNKASAASTSANNAATSEANAEDWYLRAKAIADGFAGALRPMGTRTFANLPTLASSSAGDMWNISDAFTTTSDFEEGSGKKYSAGANVYKTVSGKWDVMAGELGTVMTRLDNIESGVLLTSDEL